MEVEVVQGVVLVGGAVARQAGDLTAQPEPSLQVQGTVGPVLLAAPGETGVMDGHVGEAVEESRRKLVSRGKKHVVVRFVSDTVTCS